MMSSRRKWQQQHQAIDLLEFFLEYLSSPLIVLARQWGPRCNPVKQSLHIGANNDVILNIFGRYPLLQGTLPTGHITYLHECKRGCHRTTCSRLQSICYLRGSVDDIPICKNMLQLTEKLYLHACTVSVHSGPCCDARHSPNTEWDNDGSLPSAEYHLDGRIPRRRVRASIEPFFWSEGFSRRCFARPMQKWQDQTTESNLLLLQSGLQSHFALLFPLGSKPYIEWGLPGWRGAELQQWAGRWAPESAFPGCAAIHVWGRCLWGCTSFDLVSQHQPPRPCLLEAAAAPSRLQPQSPAFSTPLISSRKLSDKNGREAAMQGSRTVQLKYAGILLQQAFVLCELSANWVRNETWSTHTRIGYRLAWRLKADQRLSAWFLRARPHQNSRIHKPHTLSPVHNAQFIWFCGWEESIEIYLTRVSTLATTATPNCTTVITSV